MTTGAAMTTGANVTNSITLGSSGPYADAALLYRRLGWIGVIPVQRQSAAPVSGFTGVDGADPSDRDVEGWTLTRSSHNLGLRLPRDVVVIDVDCYDGKPGCQTLAALEGEFGALPPTWTSTSRQDGSRKMFFSAPFRKKWKDERVGTSTLGVEILHRGWRYARVWPSINPKTHAEERWFDPAGLLSETPPRPDAFPTLPARWVEHLTSGDVESSGELEDGDGRFPWNELLAGGPIPFGAQDDTLMRAARSCRAKNDSDAEALLKLTTLAAKFVNDPSSSKGDWDNAAILRKWEDAKQLPAGRSFGELSTELQGFVDGFVQEELSVGQKDALAREYNRRWASRALDERDQAEARGPRPRKTFGELMAEPRIEHILPNKLAAEVNILGGPSAAGKSLLARDWAIELANQRRSVLWIAGEGMHDVQERFQGHPQWTDQCATKMLYLDPINVKSDTEVQWLLAEYRDDDVALVVFDLIYDMGMSAENGMDDVGPVFRGLKRISSGWNAATLAIGHNGHNGERRFRGHSSWRQRAYVEWHMANGVLTCEKSKIARTETLTRNYELNYPNIRWMTAEDSVTTAVGRQQLIQRDFAENEDDADLARAQRLHEQLGTTVEYARKLISGFRRGK